MLRTKLSDADEGGVAAGSGALDSPFLIDQFSQSHIHLFLSQIIFSQVYYEVPLQGNVNV